MEEIETAEYTIVGLVDVYDEQGNITGQLPIGSVQTLRVDYGTKCVDLGTAKLVVAEDADEATGETGEDAVDEEEEEDEDEDATGGTGEEEVE